MMRVLRIYAWDGTNYTQMGGSPLLGDAEGDEAGYSVSISTDGTTAAMGFREAALGGGLNKAGRVRVFKYNTTSVHGNNVVPISWVKIQKINLVTLSHSPETEAE